MLKETLGKLGLLGEDQKAPADVHVQHGVNRLGKRLHYYFNYSAKTVDVSYPYAEGTNLLDGKAVGKSSSMTIGPWDLTIVEER